MQVHLWTGGPAPPEYVDMLLCERFGWTVQELDDAPADRIHEFLIMWDMESKLSKGPKSKDADIQT